jgi:hypothetical protein
MTFTPDQALDQNSGFFNRFADKYACHRLQDWTRGEGLLSGFSMRTV